MKMKKMISSILATICICLLGSGCSKGVKDTEVSRKSVGIIVDVEYISATWSQNPATVIKTERGSFFISGHRSSPIGREAFKTLWSNEEYYLYWEGSDTHYFINK
jgi:hypothetical protein